MAPDGTAALSPKDEGQGLMLSCFVSRDFGFGHQLSQEQLKLVNEYRNNQVYLDTEAAMTINQTILKPKLTKHHLYTNSNMKKIIKDIGIIKT